MDESCGKERRCEVDASLLALLALAAVMALLGGLLLAGEAQAETLIVDANGNGDYTSIQEAIDNAAAGDTLRVWAGTYDEKVVVDRTLTLTGNGSASTVIDGGGSAVVVKITAEWVNLSGFKISNGSTGVRVESDWNQVFENNIMDMEGVEAAGSGAPGGTAAGLHVSSAGNNTFWNNTISELTGGRGGTGESYGSGGMGGVAAGIYLESSTNNTFWNNTLSNFVGGRGGDGGGGWYGSGGAGGAAAGVYLNSSWANTFSNNTFLNLTGGRGGTGGRDGSGGAGGTAAGVYLKSSRANTFSNNTLVSLVGGMGGTGGSSGSGGAGGTAAGVYLKSSRANTFFNTTFLNLTGGAAGGGGGSTGAAGFATGVWIRDNASRANTLTPVNLEGAWYVPASSRWNTVNGAPLLYFYNISHLRISGITAAFAVAPVTLGGDPSTGVRYQSGESGGEGGVFTGLYLGLVTASLVENNTLSNLTGGGGGSGGRLGSGGAGGTAAGIYLEGSTSNTLRNNTLSNLTGGGGGTGGRDGSGGAGGAAVGIYLNGSRGNIFSSNTLFNLTPGVGGARGSDGSTGAAGFATGTWIKDTASRANTLTPVNLEGSWYVPDSSRWNTVEGAPLLFFYNLSHLRISGITTAFTVAPVTIGGDPYTGGEGQGGGSGGVSTGLYLGQVSDSLIENNTLFNLTGGPGGTGAYYRGSATGAYYSAGGAGGVAAGLFLEGSTGNTLSNNTLLNLTGGPGGTGGYQGSGGTGGAAAGIYLNGSRGNNFSNNTLFNLAGGAGGTGGGGGSEGAVGFATGVWVKDYASRANSLTPLTLEGSWYVPDSMAWNTVGGAPLLYFYNLSRLRISGITAAFAVVPVTLGGDPYSGGESQNGGRGGVSTGLYLGQVTASLVENNTLLNLTAGPGGAGGAGLFVPGGGTSGYSASGGTGGVAATIYLEGSTGNTLSNNTLFNLTGGVGGASGFTASGGTGGTAAGFYLESSTNNTLSNNAVFNLTGGGAGGSSGSGGLGGLAAGFYLVGSTNNTLSNNTLFNLTGGGSTEGPAGSGGTGGVAAGFYLEGSTNNTFWNNTLTGLAGGVGGGGSEGTAGFATGVWIRDNASRANTLTPVTLRDSWYVPDSTGWNTVGGAPLLYFYNLSHLRISGIEAGFAVAPVTLGGDPYTGGYGQRGGDGGVSAGLYLGQVTDSLIENNTLFNLSGGPGGTGGYWASGGRGGAAVGFYLEGSSNNTLSNNTLFNLTGGLGGTGGYWASGGRGGAAVGFYLEGSSNNTLSNNTLSNLTGGPGGTGGFQRSGGLGGVAMGFYLERSTFNTFSNNTLTGLSGGPGGSGGQWGSEGEVGFATGVWLKDTVSRANILTPVTLEGAWYVPDSTRWNTVNGAPLLYFYNLSHLRISGINAAFAVAPVTLGGDLFGGGGVSAGLYLGQVTASLIEDNTLFNLIGGPGGTGGYFGAGNAGGVAAGFYLEGSPGNTLQNNTLFNLTGGAGGAGGWYGAGGAGGAAAGFYLRNSPGNTLSNNTLFNLTGAPGGAGQGNGSGGAGGAAVGFYLHSSPSNTFYNNTLLSLAGGAGGAGGGYGAGGVGGVAAGFYLGNSSANTFYNITLSNLSGGPGGDGEYQRSGGAGGVAAGIYLNSSRANAFYSSTLFNLTGGPGGTGGQDGSGGAGGATVGFYSENSSGNAFYSSTLLNLTGGGGGTGGPDASGGAGGIAVGIHLNRSTGNTFSNNTLVSLAGGEGGSGGRLGSGGTGGAAAGIYLNSSRANTFFNTTFLNLTGGGGGAGGSSGSTGAAGFATGTWIKDTASLANTLTPVTLQGSWYVPDSIRWNTVEGAPLLFFYNISRLRISGISAVFAVAPVTLGSDLSTGGYKQDGGSGGVSTVLYLGQVTDSLIQNNTLSNLTGGPGGTGGWLGAGGAGGAAAGIYLDGSSGNTFSNNTLFNLTGGGGGTGGRIGSGGVGGTAAGIYLDGSSGNTFSNNTLFNLTGGAGGSGGNFGSGGAGGIAAGVYLENSPTNTFQKNTLLSLAGGVAGAGGGSHPEGAAGFATGVWVNDTVSRANTLTPVTLEGSWYVPDSTRWNTVEGAPLLYFYNLSNLRISGISAAFAVAPVTLGGDPSTGGYDQNGGEGGVSTGLYLGQVTASLIQNNTFASLAGGPGGTGGRLGLGGAGGAAAGFYLEGSTGNTLQNNTISSLNGGPGGTGGSGGAGGAAVGFYLEGSSGNSLSNNTVSSLAGGEGGNAGYQGRGGAGGVAVGFYLKGSNGNSLSNNAVSSLAGGEGGDAAGTQGSGGAGGVAAGFYVESSNNNTVQNNTLSNLTGGGAGAGSSGGAGGAAVGIYLESSTSNTVQNNTLSSLTGGWGGTGWDSGGTGGAAVGIYLESSNNNTFLSNALVSLAGGVGGGGEPGGAAGFATGVWIRDNASRANTLTPVTRQGSWYLPDSTTWNTVEGAPLLYFYNLSNLRISGIEGGFAVAPVTIGGDPYTGGFRQRGGRGGVSTGLYLGKVTDSLIENNALSNLTGGPGGTGGDGGPGGAGGVAAGIYLEDSSVNAFYNNTLFNLAGGVGGSGGRFGSGGTGGVAAGLYLENSPSNIFYNNTISNLMGGGGGSGGFRGSGGAGGLAVGLYLESSSGNAFYNNTISNLAGGPGGKKGGGSGGSDGPLGSSYHFYLRSSPTTLSINSTSTAVSLDSTSRLTVKNYLHIQTFSEGGAPVEGVDILVSDNNAPLYATPGFNGDDPRTDANGTIHTVIVTDRIYQGSLPATQNITTVKVRYWTWTETRFVNMSASHTELFYIPVDRPYLLNGTVSLNSGNKSTYFNFTVIYAHDFGREPDYVRLVVDNSATYNLSSVDNSTDYQNGTLYYINMTLEVGLHTYYFEASDGTNATKLPETGNYSGPRVNNFPPTAVIDSVSPAAATEGEPVTLNGSGTDPEGYIVGYRWRSSLVVDNLSYNASFTTDELPPGDHTLYFAVQDDLGFWSEDVNASLHINARPVASIANDTAAFAHAGGPVLLNGSGSDADGEVVEYRWESDRDGPLGNGSRLTLTNLTPGTHNLSFSVRDDFGARSEAAEWSLHINARPVVAVVVTPQVVLKGGVVTLAVSASDSDGNMTFYRYRLDHSASSFNLTEEYNVTDHGPLSTAGWPGGNYTLVFQAGDSEGGWSDPLTTWLYVNVPPLAVIDAVSAVRAANGSVVVTLAGHGVDDETITALAWRSDLDGPLGGGNSLVLSNLTPGTHTLSLRVRDEWGAWSEWEAWGEPVTVAAAADGNGGNNALLILLMVVLVAAAGAGGAAAWRYRARLNTRQLSSETAAAFDEPEGLLADPMTVPGAVAPGAEPPSPAAFSHDGEGALVCQGCGSVTGPAEGPKAADEGFEYICPACGVIGPVGTGPVG